MLDLLGDLLFFDGHVLEDLKELVDALAVDEDGACKGHGVQVVAKGVAAGDRKGLDITEALVVEQRFAGVATVILDQGLFGGGNIHLEICQVRELGLEDVRGPSDVGAELELVKPEALVHERLEHCKVQAHVAEVARNFRVRRRSVDGVVAFGVVVRGTHGWLFAESGIS